MQILENKIALIGIMVNDWNATETLNSVLHEYAVYILGRMGVPYKTKNVNIISVALDAPADVINALTGKIGRISGIKAKTLFSD
jgi:putative iron-only hydrogenase system regulator